MNSFKDKVEAGVVRYIIGHPSDLEYVLSMVDENQFYDESTKWIISEMKKDIKSGFILGVDYYSKLVDSPDRPYGVIDIVRDGLDEAENPTPIVSRPNLMSYIKLIKMNYWKNELQTSLSARLENLLKLDIREIPSFIQTMVEYGQNAGIDLDISGSTAKLSEIFNEVMDEAARINDLNPEEGLIYDRFCGTHSLNLLLKGLKENDTVCFAARPKVGKSSVANDVISWHIENDYPLWVGSGENTREDTVLRSMSHTSTVKAEDILKGSFYKKENTDMQNLLTMWAGRIKDGSLDDKIFIEGGHGFSLSIPSFRRTVQYYKSMYGVKRYVIDRIGLFQEILRGKNDVTDRMDVCSQLREISNSEGVAIIAFSQCNSSVERAPGKRPEMQHVYGATAVQANFRKVVLLYRPEVYDIYVWPDIMGDSLKGRSCRNTMEMRTVLNNDGKPGRILVRFDGSHLTIRDLPKKNHQIFGEENDDVDGEGRY
jgi:replicative DNA helicase